MTTQHKIAVCELLVIFSAIIGPIDLFSESLESLEYSMAMDAIYHGWFDSV